MSDRERQLVYQEHIAWTEVELTLRILGNDLVTTLAMRGRREYNATHKGR